MKKYLKYSGICAALFAVVAFILMLATPALAFRTTVLGQEVEGDPISGAVAIFGKTENNIVTHGAWVGVVAFILVLVAIVIIVAGIVLPLLKVNALEKFAGVLNLVAVGALITAGILMFFLAPAFYGANNDGKAIPDGVTGVLKAGWVISAILSIVAGAFAILPAAFDFVGSKKK